MASVVYIICALLSLSCSLLLFRAYSQNRFRLLLWSGIGFMGFALNNLLLFIDSNVVPYDLSIMRTLPALIGMVILVYGLISDVV